MANRRDKEDRTPARWVEGFVHEDAKPVSRYTKAKELRDMQRELKDREIEANTRLQEIQMKLHDLQESLSACNQEHQEYTAKLQEMETRDQAQLSADHKYQITQITTQTLDSFVTKRQWKAEEQFAIDVHYLADDGASFGNAGGGSRHAKFLVHADEKFHSLAKQAAKYWSLDENKVFFLDLDGRIVPDNVDLGSIILPPVPRGAAPSAASTAPAPASGSAALPAGDDLGQAELWTVKDRPYILTLVVAGTVLTKEDLKKPRGETWHDFTFKESELIDELENTRKKNQDQDLMAKAVSLEDIPSLHALKQEGLKKLANKKADEKCRILEVFIFVLSMVLFYTVLIPEVGLAFNMQLVDAGNLNDLTLFSIGERARYKVDQYVNISDFDEYYGWFTGPLRRTVMQGGLMKDRNIHVLSVFAYKYSNEGYAALSPAQEQSCFELGGTCRAGGSAQPAGNATGGAGNSSSSAPGPGAADADAANATNTTPAPGGSNATGPTMAGCFDACLNPRVRAVLQDGLNDCHQLPRCSEDYDMQAAQTLLLNFQSMVQSPYGFSNVHGYLHQYAAQGPADVVAVDTRDPAAFEASARDILASLDPHAGSATGDEHKAALIAVFAYSPSLNAAFMYQMLAEKPRSGSILMSLHRKQIPFKPHSIGFYLAKVLVIICTIGCLLSELRRIMHCPKRWFYEGRKDHLSVYTPIFFLLPAFQLAQLFLYAIVFDDADDVIGLGDHVGLDDETLIVMHGRAIVGNTALVMDLCMVCIYTLLFFHYVLMNYPRLKYGTEVQLLYNLMFIVLFIFAFVLCFYMAYCAKSTQFMNLSSTLMFSVKFAQHSVDNWWTFYRDAGPVWFLVMVPAFVLIGLTLNNMACAIMLSHKKEWDLYENYRYHPFWTLKISTANKDPKSFNPAAVGWDFTKGLPPPASMVA